MKKASLIFTSSNDIHADRLVVEAESLSLNTIRLNLDSPSDWSLDYHNGDIRIRTKSETFGLEDLSSVFVRRVPNFDSFLTSVPKSAEDYAEYIAKQKFTLFSDCLAVLDAETKFVNPLASSTRLGKAVQGKLANEVGFITPQTYMGDDPILARKFCTEIFDKKDIPCIKPIINSKVNIRGESHTQFTNTLKPESLDSLDSLEICPTIFQNYVEKAYEIRATVIGDEVFAAKIDSQKAGGGTATDWRRYNIPLTPHTPIELPQSIQDKIFALHKKLYLIYSAFDFIVTTKGEYVFLETNSYGQWLWIEDLTGLKITKGILNYLSR